MPGTVSRSSATAWMRIEALLPWMAGQAQVPCLHSQHASVRVRMGVVKGDAGDHPAGEGLSLELHGGDDIDLVFGRCCPVAIAVETEGRKPLLALSDLLGPRRKAAHGAVLLDLQRRITDGRPDRSLVDGSGAGGRHDTRATRCNDTDNGSSNVHAVSFSFATRLRCYER